MVAFFNNTKFGMRNAVISVKSVCAGCDVVYLSCVKLHRSAHRADIIHHTDLSSVLQMLLSDLLLLFIGDHLDVLQGVMCSRVLSVTAGYS